MAAAGAGRAVVSAADTTAEINTAVIRMVSMFLLEAWITIDARRGVGNSAASSDADAPARFFFERVPQRAIRTARLVDGKLLEYGAVRSKRVDRVPVVVAARRHEFVRCR